VAKKQTVVKGALEVAEDAFHNHEMGLTGAVHVEAYLLNHVGDARPSEDEVLESLDHAVVDSQVDDMGTHVRGDIGLSVMGTHVGGDLGLSVYRCSVGLADTHATVLNDIPSVLALVREEVVESLLH
jgi:hypothetical protein